MVVGGVDNLAYGNSAFAAGGSSGHGNTAYGSYSVAIGGLDNYATGWYSYALGRRAKALTDGAFVYADSTDADFNSVYANSFNIRVSSGLHVVAGYLNGIKVSTSATSTDSILILGSVDALPTNTVNSGVFAKLSTDGKVYISTMSPVTAAGDWKALW